MTLAKLTLLLVLGNLVCIEQVTAQCSSPFTTNNETNFCYFYKANALSWMDAYNQCLTKTLDGLLIQIFSATQFNTLKRAKIDQTSLFWLGATNFASFRDSKWHWLDGTVVDDSIITWCPQSTHETAIGTHCAAYDSSLQCVSNYPCSSLLSAPCVSATNGINKNGKLGIIARQSITTLCTSSFGGTYANWWTYSVLLLNWFTLFSFVLYLYNRFVLNKNLIAVTSAILILSLIMIIIFAILWGIQYQDIIQIPVVNVIIGCLAGFFLLVVVFIILNDRTRVQRVTTCRIIIFAVIVIESFLMLGLILCVAYCSGYITLAPTSIEKDITASLLSTLVASISILLYTSILSLLENPDQERGNAIKPAQVAAMPLPQAATTQASASLRQMNGNATMTNTRPTTFTTVKKTEQIDRATSPVDDRILQEFYSDRPKDVHQYSLEGRQYVVFEGATLTDIETYRKDLTEAMLLQETLGLRAAIDRARSSVHASTLADEIHQAQNLAAKLV